MSPPQKKKFGLWLKDCLLESCIFQLKLIWRRNQDDIVGKHWYSHLPTNKSGWMEVLKLEN